MHYYVGQSPSRERHIGILDNHGSSGTIGDIKGTTTLQLGELHRYIGDKKIYPGRH